MRDPKRIPRIIEQVLKIWERNPDLRLGQLIENCRGFALDAYNLEDDVLERRLSEVYGEPQAVGAVDPDGGSSTD